MAVIMSTANQMMRAIFASIFYGNSNEIGHLISSPLVFVEAKVDTGVLHVHEKVDG